MACPDCVTRSLHEGTPQGTEIKVGGLSTYAVGDEKSDKIIVIGSDIFGWSFVNTRLLADEYAARGFRVLIPDFFDGWVLPQWTLTPHDPSNAHPSLFTRLVLLPLSLFVLVPFILRQRSSQVASITRVAGALRAAHPRARLGFVGFCWGGRYAIALNGLWDASAAAHPSLVRYPRELDEGVVRPFCLAVAEKDPMFDEARARDVERRLGEREEGKGRVPFEVRVYEGVGHGWTTRGDPKDPVKMKARDDARDQVVDWFLKHLASAPSAGGETPAGGEAADAVPSITVTNPTAEASEP